MAKKSAAAGELRSNPKCVMAIAAHPDDIEFCMAGTLFALRDLGWEVHYMNISNGNVGSTVLTLEQTAKKRLAEAKAACKLAGFTHHLPVADDLGIFYERKQLAKVTAAIRKARPSIVLTQSLDDYAEDHERATRLAAGAAFCKSMKNSPCSPMRPPYFGDIAVYHALPHGMRNSMGKRIRAGLWADIGGYVGMKKDMLACHESQKLWLDATQGMDSYLRTAEELSAAAGKMSGAFASAEGWRKHNLLGYAADLSWDPLRDALGKRAVVDKRYEKWLDE